MLAHIWQGQALGLARPLRIGLACSRGFLSPTDPARLEHLLARMPSRLSPSFACRAPQPRSSGLATIYDGEVVQRCRETGMLRSQDPLANSESPPLERFRVGITPLMHVKRGKILQQIEDT